MADEPLLSEEIDALLQAAQAAPAEHDLGSRAKRQVKPYDFTHPNKFSKEQLRALEMIYASCGRGLTTQLSALLRAPTEVEPVSIAETSYMDLIGLLAEGAPIALLGMDPLVGHATLEMDPLISFALIDRLLGGPGGILHRVRELTEIEKRVMDRVVERIGKCIADAWSPVVALKPEVEMIIGSTLFSQMAQPDDRIVLASFAMKFGPLTGDLLFGMPVTSLDPVLSKLNAQQWFSAGRSSSKDAFASAIRYSLDRADLDVAVQLGRAEVTMQELLDLQVGDLICLDRKAGADLDLLVGGHVKYRGQPGKIGRKLGFKVTQIVTEED